MTQSQAITRRPHTWLEELVDACVHVIGVIMGGTGGLLLVSAAFHRSHATSCLAICVYVLGLMAMLLASAAYNVFYHTRWRGFFRNCDHAAIFLLIAATMTPFTFGLGNTARLISLGVVVWAISGFGIYLQFVWPRVFGRIAVPLYLAQGWLGLLLFGPLAMQLTSVAIGALIVGGCLYTIGVLFHLREQMPFHNAIWHFFVLAAALCHYVAVLDGLVLAGVA
jgi:hemolysin III